MIFISASRLEPPAIQRPRAIGRGSRLCEHRTCRDPTVVDDPEGEQERQVKALCDVLNAYDVNYVVFGSFAARLQRRAAADPGR